MQIRWTCGWRPGARGSGGGTTPRTAWRPWGLPPLLPPRRATRCRARRGTPRRYKRTLRPARRGTPRRYKQPQHWPPALRWRAGWLTCRPRGGANRPWFGCTTAACGWISTPGRDDDEGGVSIPRPGWSWVRDCGCVCSDVACRVAIQKPRRAPKTPRRYKNRGSPCVICAYNGRRAGESSRCEDPAPTGGIAGRSLLRRMPPTDISPVGMPLREYQAIIYENGVKAGSRRGTPRRYVLGGNGRIGFKPPHSKRGNPSRAPHGFNLYRRLFPSCV